MKREFLPATLISRAAVGPDLVTLSLQVPEAVSRALRSPGQYHRLRAASGHEALLAIASPPSARIFEYLVKAHGSGARLLDALSGGDTVDVSLPEGPGFPVGQAKGRNVFLVGTGTGFAPLRAVLEAVRLRRSDFGDVTALYGAASTASLAWSAAFDAWARERIALIPTLSKPEAHWTGLVGRVQAHVERMLPDDAVTFLCGHRDMMTAVRAILVRRGVARDRVLLNLPDSSFEPI